MDIRHCLGLVEVSRVAGTRMLTNAYLHVLHVIKDVLLVLLGGCTRKFLAKSLLLDLVDLTDALSLCRRASIDTLIIAFDEERLTVPVSRVLALNWTESHVGVVVGYNEWKSILLD
jgi:hypothetical protein